MCHHSGDVLSSSHEHFKPSNLFLCPATQALTLSFITGIGPAPSIDCSLLHTIQYLGLTKLRKTLTDWLETTLTAWGLSCGVSF